MAALAKAYPLMLVTKGDLLHQTSKLERSGLRGRFRFVEVVSHKTVDVYAAILSRHDVAADRFLMIGNSLKSDVIPVAEAGGRAVHVPAALTWSHEHADLPSRIQHRTFELTTLDRLPEVIETIERGQRSTRSAPRTSPSRRAGAASVADALPEEAVEVEEPGVINGLMLLALLNVLNISRLGIT